jgi:hypothetical protein
VAELWDGGPITLPHSFTHDGVAFTIPELPVTDLLRWLAAGTWWELYPNAVDQEAVEPIRARLFDPDDPLDVIHLHTVATALYGRLAGMGTAQASGWWPALRLANCVMDRWPLFHAWCISKGIITPLAGTLMSLLGAAYAWLRDGLGPDQLSKVEYELWSVPMRAAAPRAHPDQVPEHIREQEATAFLAALGEQLPGQRPMAGKTY